MCFHIFLCAYIKNKYSNDAEKIIENYIGNDQSNLLIKVLFNQLSALVKMMRFTHSTDKMKHVKA